MATDTDLAYIAGIIDGEGYIGIKRSAPYHSLTGRVSPGYHARIQVRMVDEGAIRFLAETLGGWYYPEKPHAHKGRSLFCYQASDKAACTILEALLPWLRVKLINAETVLAFRTLQLDGPAHRTKVTGERDFRHWTGKTFKVRNLAFSDEYVAMLDAFWQRCSSLNHAHDD